MGEISTPARCEGRALWYLLSCSGRNDRANERPPSHPPPRRPRPRARRGRQAWAYARTMMPWPAPNARGCGGRPWRAAQASTVCGLHQMPACSECAQSQRGVRHCCRQHHEAPRRLRPPRSHAWCGAPRCSRAPYAGSHRRPPHSPWLPSGCAAGRRRGSQCPRPSPGPVTLPPSTDPYPNPPGGGGGGSTGTVHTRPNRTSLRGRGGGCSARITLASHYGGPPPRFGAY